MTVSIKYEPQVSNVTPHCVVAGDRVVSRHASQHDARRAYVEEIERRGDSAVYRKTATVTARKVPDGQTVTVASLEGPMVAAPGDYVVTANTETAESWVVRGAVFEKTYELVV
jgi:hypothetical protein